MGPSILNCVCAVRFTLWLLLSSYVSPECWHRAGIYLSICAYDGGRLIAMIVGSNPAEGMEVRLLCLLCVVQVAGCAKG